MKSFRYSLFIVMFCCASCHKEDIALSANASDVFFIKSLGFEMPVRVYGNTLSKTIVLIVHGGPGDTALFFRSETMKNLIEKNYAMAYWDQPASGNSQGNKASLHLDYNDYVDILKKVILVLKKRYGSDASVFLLSHSWGGFISSAFVTQGDNQELIKGWIDADGVHNFPLNDFLTWQKLIQFGQQEMAAGRNSSQWQEIVNYCQSVSPGGNFDVSVQLNQYAHQTDALISDVNEANTSSLLNQLIFHQQFAFSAFLTNTFVNNRTGVTKQIADISFSEYFPEVKTPILLLWGKYDFICPEGLADDIISHTGSDYKEKEVFLHSGHTPMLNEPDAFYTRVKTFVDQFK